MRRDALRSVLTLLFCCLVIAGCAGATASLDPKPLFDPDPLLATESFVSFAHLLVPMPLLSPDQLDEIPLLAPIRILRPTPLLSPSTMK
jgi:hypothetical protein